MNKEPDKTGKNRDEKGRFIKGVSGNPKGRPPGSISITAEIKKKLEEVPAGEKKTYLEALILKILKRAIVDESDSMIKEIWNYIDGKPKERKEVEGGELPFKVIIEKDDPKGTNKKS